MLITSALISGLGLGSMYGLLALGFYVTYAVSSTVNFAQGSSMMLGAVFAYTFAVTLGWPFWSAALLALALCALYGVIVEWIAVRPFVRRGSNAWLVATVALGIVADNLVLFTFGKEPRGFVLPWATGSTQVLGVGVSPLQAVIPAVGLGLAAALHLVSRRSGSARRCSRSCRNRMPRASSHHVPVAISAAFAVATGFAGAAGILIAPLFNLHSDMVRVFG